MSELPQALTETSLPGLELVHRGKVRDVYAVDAEHLLFVATDRVSAFDRVLGSGIPGKGTVLTQLSVAWFRVLEGEVPTHLAAWRAADMPEEAAAAARQLGGRAMLVRRAEVVPVECVVRGWLAGSVREAYERTGEVQGVKLPPGIPLGGELPGPIFTPTTKARAGHDEPLTFEELEARVGSDLATELRDLSIGVFRRAAERCRDHGLILCDTKLEFGRLPDGRLVLADEVLTPDSSRFFKTDEHQPGRTPIPWDKQLVRDYLLANKHLVEGPTAPQLPAEVVSETAARYRQVYEMLAGRSLQDAVAEATA